MFIWLKRFRVVISLIFFFLILFLFIDISESITGKLTRSVLFFQFVPSLLHFVTLFTIGSAGFIFVILLTLLFGRVYCSFLCPLGTFQDILITLAKKIRKKRYFSYRKAHNYIRYSILLVVAVSFVFGITLIPGLLDPYSLFGRISVSLLKPVVIFANNLLSKTLFSFDIYSISPVRNNSAEIPVILITSAFFLLLLWMSFYRGRLFCNTVCPVGALLGLFSGKALFRIRLDQNACNSCGACSNVCKASCIERTAKTVDFTRCIGCLNCLDVCPKNGVTFGLPSKKSEEFSVKPVPTDRRDFISKAGAGIVLFSVMPLSLKSQFEKLVRKAIEKKHPVTPPGSLSHAHFNSLCTACHLCVSACPTQVIQPSWFEYGIKGFMQPHMNYYDSFCNYDCTICSEVCPTGAIMDLTLEKKKETQIGYAIFIKQNCVVYTDQTDCGACSEHCPTKAVDMVPYRNNLHIPEVNTQICVGCGACEYACPVEPKAIYIEGNVIHQQALLPATQIETQQPEKKDVVEEDFPF